jgi:peptidoglycan/LPS O-acetylase OafA/YrhL
MSLVVAIFHFTAPGHFLNGALAVDFFFVLSGLVLSMAYLGRRDLSMGEFFRVRLNRLYPLHFFSLMLVIFLYMANVILINYPKAGDMGVAWSWQFPSEYYVQGVLFSLLQSIFLINSVGFESAHAYWNGPSWSVSVELWVGLLAFSWFRGWSTVALVILSLAGYAIMFNHYHAITAHDDVLGGILSAGVVRGVAGMCAGMAIHRVFSRASKLESAAGWGAQLLQISSLLGIFWSMHSSHEGGINDFVGIVLCLVLMVSLYAGRPTCLAWTLRLPFLVWTGTISYSIYLMHYPVLYLLKNLAGMTGTAWYDVAVYLAMTIAVSAFTYKYIELRGRSVMSIIHKLVT